MEGCTMNILSFDSTIFSFIDISSNVEIDTVFLRSTDKITVVRFVRANYYTRTTSVGKEGLVSTY
jgi:hypothetical protein